jgi:hypothetical protein
LWLCFCALQVPGTGSRVRAILAEGLIELEESDDYGKSKKL